MTKLEIIKLSETIKSAIKNGKTLLYLASGNNTDGFSELPFDNVILVDLGFEDTKTVGNLLILKMDAIEAVFLLSTLNVKIDAFVCINEGLYEGGGNYPINSNWFMGLLMLLLKTEYIHISCPSSTGADNGNSMQIFPLRENLSQKVKLNILTPKSFPPIGVSVR